MIEITTIIGFSLLIAFCVLLAIQVIYYVAIFSRLIFYKPVPASQQAQAVSVIICARNEEKNLRKYLKKILEQKYSAPFEVIVVNDCSYDESGVLLEQLQKDYPRLKVCTISEQEKYQHGKKFALTIGIKAAQHDLLLLTDADCDPGSDKWLQLMQNNFVKNTEIVIGYGAYMKKSGMLNKLIRFDTFYNAMQFLSFALVKSTYMGVGRNLAYRKELFFKNKGFANHYHLLSGDDDLFINEVATETNTTVELNPATFTYSEPKRKFSTWFHQKQRHLSTYKMYKPKHKWALGVLAITYLPFYLCFAALLILQFEPRLVLGLFGVRYIIQLFIYGGSMKRLHELDLLIYLLFFDLFMSFFYPILSVMSLFSRKKRWR